MDTLKKEAPIREAEAKLQILRRNLRQIQEELGLAGSAYRRTKQLFVSGWSRQPIPG